MREPDDLSGLFEDLEQQAEGIQLAERDAELVDRAQGEYAGVSFAARVHASFGRDLTLLVSGVGTIRATLLRAGSDWCLLEVREGVGRQLLVRLEAVLSVEGLSPRATAEAARPVTGRLGFGSTLRRLAEHAQPLVVQRVDGSRSALLVTRVGADFLEGLAVPTVGAEPAPVVVPFAAVAAVSRGL